MTDYTSTVSRLGEDSAVVGTDPKGLFLKVFAGEVLTAFNTNNIAMPLHNVRTIASGKSAQFPLTGISTTGNHTAGDEIAPTAINHSEKVITINDLLVSSAFIANIDEAMNHYDVRSIYSKQIGEALAKKADKDIFAAIGNASLGVDNTGAALPQADTSITSGATVTTGAANAAH